MSDQGEKRVVKCFIVEFGYTFLCVIVIVGLSILYGLLQNVWQENSAAQGFYQTYYTDVLQHVLSVVTDTSHTAGKDP